MKNNQSTLTVRAEIIAPGIEDYKDSLRKVHELVGALDAELHKIDNLWPIVRVVGVTEYENGDR